MGERGSGRDLARWLLAGIRLFNGMAALVAPGWLVGQLGADPRANNAAPYIFRMFGIRTVIIGAQLLGPPGAGRARALRLGLLIHASDTVAALLAGVTGQLPARAARKIVLISLTNTVLALLAQEQE